MTDDRKLEQAKRSVGTPDQWRRVERNLGRGGAAGRRAEIAVRDARLFGTDPSWFGF